jgi:hypothetical protein
VAAALAEARRQRDFQILLLPNSGHRTAHWPSLQHNRGENIVENVLERMGTTESTTPAIKRELDGKMWITSSLCENPKVILPGEVLEVRNVDGRLHIARKVKNHDEWDPRSSLMTPKGRAMSPLMTDARCAATHLAPVYGWFTEGFDTRDLKEAKALLAELAP